MDGKARALSDDQVRNLLESIRNPDTLEDPSWLASNLVQLTRRQYPTISDSQVLRVALAPVLGALRAEDERFGDLLQGRYWEGLTVQEMIDVERPGGRPLAERTLRDQSKRARARFARHLVEHEAAAAQQLALLDSSRAGLPTAAGTHRSILTRPALIGSAAVLGLILISVFSPLDSISPRPLGTDAQSPSATPSPAPACGEIARATPPSGPQFLRHQGVSAFTAENSGGLVHSNKVRSVAIDRRGLWAGFFSSPDNPDNGLANYNKLTQTWADCDTPDGTLGKDVNDIAIDPEGRVWVAAEKTGVAMYDGSQWQTFTEKDGLPSADTFGLTVDSKGAVWVCTWSGVATFDSSEWSTPFTTQNGTLASDHAHAIAFDSVGDVWVGFIRDGVSRRRRADGSWVHLTKEEGSLSGNEVRSILVRPERESTPESVWIATNDGGISVYERGAWSYHTADTGLLGNSVNDLAIDRYNRVWAATSTGVAYFDGDVWTTYTTLPSLSIAIGPDCQDCPYDTDHVLVGTLRHGITHSRLPLDTSAVEILKVVYPEVVSPGAHFVPEITIAPKAPYKLDGNRGDFLSNTDEDDALLFGTHEHIAVKGVIESGAAFTFREPNLPFIAPSLPDGVDEKTYTSTWRMWMHTRYVGPPVQITFTVRR